VHSLGEGTDAGTAWFLAMTGLVVVPALLLLALRTMGAWSGSPRRRSTAARAVSQGLLQSEAQRS
jgi:hypothetical protein